MTIADGTIPNEFTAGARVRASEVNANFDALLTAVNNAISALNAASGTQTTLDARLDAALNEDGSLKSTATLGGEWISGPVPTYVSGTQFTALGDKTSTFVISRRIKFTDASTVYSAVTASSYNSGTGRTTVTVADSVLTAALSALDYSIFAPVSTGTHGLPLATATVEGIATQVQAASATVSGKIELATQAEVDAGTDALRAVTPATLAATTVPKAAMVGVLNVSVIDIGDWDMDATASVNVAHGLTLSKIRSISTSIRNDAGTGLIDFGSYLGNVAATGNTAVADATNVVLTRQTGGLFDTTDYNATSYNRGWVTIWHIA